MRRFSNCCFTGRISKTHRTRENFQESRETMENPQTSKADNCGSEKMKENGVISQSSLADNIILNHDFSRGLHSWHLNCCSGYVVSGESGCLEGVPAISGGSYAVITNCKECWQGLEQDITSRVSPGSTYTVSSFVRVLGPLQGSNGVQATLRLEYPDSATSYLFVGRAFASMDQWEKLEGTFSLETIPHRIVFYLEGPSPELDLLIDSVVVFCSSQKCEKMKENRFASQNSPADNIILNHDFSGGLHSWHLNCCNGYVVSGESGYLDGVSAVSGGSYAVITNRKECWQGLEQDITSRVSPGSTYTVSSFVRVLLGPLQGSTGVQATLRLEYPDSAASYLFVGRASASVDQWEKLEGTFSLETTPNRIVFYLEGPSPGVDLLIDSVVVLCSSKKCEQMKDNRSNSHSNSADNIILNPDFSRGLHSWHLNCCDGYVVSGESGYLGGVLANSGENYAVITNRKEYWQGLEQDITSRVSAGSTYMVSACIRVFGPLQGSTGVQATLRLHHSDSATSYLSVGRASASKDRWEKLEGTFSLETMPNRVVFYLEGPSPGIDLLIDSVLVSCSSLKECESEMKKYFADGDENIIQNPSFEDGLNNWSGRGCKILPHSSTGDRKVQPLSGKFFASATERKHSWNGIQQEITGRVQRKLAYEVTALVRIFGNNVTSADVRASLWVKGQNLREQYISIANVQASDKEWVRLQGKFLLNGSSSRVVIYFEGPPPGTDILLNSLVVKHAAKIPPSLPPVIENAAFGVNVIKNSNLNDGLNGWSPLGNCTLRVGTGSPHLLPPMARDSLGPYEPLSGRYIHVTNRTQTWMGPSQIITDKIKLYLTYQVSAWVRLGPGVTSCQNVNVALGVDDRWVNGGQVEASADMWHEIGGSFRIEKQPSKVMVYIQGPSSGVDFMVAGLQIFPVDRQARFKHLKKQTDQIRKRDVILKLVGADINSLFGTIVKVRQTENCFPFGSCISRTNIDNEDFVNFFVKNFNWAVFGNELKWPWTEPQQGNFNYKDADELLDFCKNHNIECRGHCIFWEVDDTIQSWVRSLNKSNLMTAFQNRLTGLLTRYKGKFRHYDVNNEMLHGSFYQDRLGKDFRSYMFKMAHQLDPSSTLFVNDYHVEDGCDTRSSPEKYIQHILDLQEQGAPVGGIGIQGHIDSPVGPIICSALDKLAILGLPIWFTEVDVSSINEYVRADDLEVMLREVFAHPAVEGIMLWGFWELFMCRANTHLIDAEGGINEAGKRYLALKQEWLSHAQGHLDDQAEFRFKGFHGAYDVEIVTQKKKISKTFIVDKDDSPLVVTINL